ncbi:MAG: hypothetical protein WBC29_00200 [Candidatus Moraniibacteriota bacterium]
MAVTTPLILFIPEVFALTAIIGFLNGMVPGGLRPGDSIQIALDKVFRGLAYVALADSFMFLFFGTWNFGLYPGAAKLILAAAASLTCWAAVHREGTWFKKISLWYPVAVIAVALVATLVPGIIPGKAEQALKRANQALVDIQNDVAKKQIDEIMGHIEKLRLENDPQNVHLIEEDVKKMEWIGRNLTRKGVIEGFFTDPDHQTPSSWVIAIATIFIIFWALRKYPRVTNIVGALFLLLIIGGIIWFAFTVPGKELGKEILKGANSIKEGAVVYSTSLSKIEEATLNVPNIDPGYYRFRIYPQREQYAFSCANGGSGFGNPIPAAENVTASDRTYGNILLRGSKTVASDAQPSEGNLILVQDDRSVIVSFNFPQEKMPLIRGCAIAGGLKMEVQFIKS